MPFEVFKKRTVPLVKQPYVTVQKRGTMSLNKAAYVALGSPAAIQLLWDPDRRVIGFQAVDPMVEHAYPVRGAGSDKAGSYIISGSAFTRYHDIETDVSRRWPGKMETDILTIDLKEEGTEVTSNRKKKGEAAADAAPPVPTQALGRGEDGTMRVVTGGG